MLDWAAVGIQLAFAVLSWIGWCWMLLARTVRLVSTAKNESERHLEALLKQAATYDEWVKVARRLDEVQGNEEWKKEEVTDLYDYKFLKDSLLRLRSIAATGDPHALAFFLRAGLRRVLAGMTNPKLYEHSVCGTKRLIEDYLEEVCRQLQRLCTEQYPDFDLDRKLAFFTETRQAFGRTALLLSGGASFGMYHLGVIRVLHEQRLLPRIICGSSVGSIIACIVAVHREEELDRIFQPGYLNLEGFRSLEGSLRRKIVRFIRTGVLMDVNKLQACVRANVGDLTFEEAYRRTGRVLNISVTSTTNFEVPRLLNYLTTPHVLLWSAACASCAVPGLYAPVELMAKARDGSIVPFHPYGLKWSDGSVESDLPMARLAEQFNVNHFIVSQVNPHVLPFLSRPVSKRASLWTRLKLLCKGLFFSEIKHRLLQLTEAGLLPPLKPLLAVPGIVSQIYEGDITIVPDVTLEDYRHIISNPSPERIARCMLKGARSTFPRVDAIRNNTAIERCLDHCVRVLRAQLQLQLVQPGAVVAVQPASEMEAEVVAVPTADGASTEAAAAAATPATAAAAAGAVTEGAVPAAPSISVLASAPVCDSAASGDAAAAEAPPTPLAAAARTGSHFSLLAGATPTVALAAGPTHLEAGLRDAEGRAVPDERVRGTSDAEAATRQPFSPAIELTSPPVARELPDDAARLRRAEVLASAAQAAMSFGSTGALLNGPTARGARASRKLVL